MSQEFCPLISPPTLSRGSDRDLCLDSTIQELPMYTFQVEVSLNGVEVAKYFDKYPLLPGVILLEQGKFTGMMSRRRLIEFLMRPYGQDLFAKEPLDVLYRYARLAVLVLADTTPILAAMQHILRRSPEFLAEPLVVQTADNSYRLLDPHELNIAAWQIRGIETQVRYERSQAQMIQNDKMARLGRLVDGVAHEILDPVGFIWGNLTYISNYSQDLLKLIAAYDECLSPGCEEINDIKEEIEFDYLEKDLSKALNSARSGAERLKKLVTSLQNFCHIDAVYPKPVDLHASIDSIVILIKSRLKGEITIIKNYGKIPPVSCFIGQLNQVLMNILSHAVDSLLDETVRRQLQPDSGQSVKQSNIEITTEVISQAATRPNEPDSRWVSICVADNGTGMSEELQQQIRENFSIEKRTEKETSLAVSYRIITARHGGKLNFSSKLGIGTKFEILLPLL
ncbi:sensor histidine kinase [Anabaena sp. FACHB-709]|uniref:Histidine kinase n=2 Tax=Nostocaceae TaxID=1162 RepID=A0A1Z4KJ26_ANAVA|nr:MULTISPECIES: ATP-binding protein [Nostocaceae]BAY68989.1 histidine kinase [Trichormus variabilis NIES-23]HBW33083.1 histidine kinase [Nostoc sp. UBA8866]MBD2170560.1 sensor histidine kinase [Anabaena cylindrica FACHB-318]MBD2261964.1 sensor histidine kinase [Anabaena sp. FACHB-709]MBD2271893.1 sensor histidine kinase [Nostoc sp. PCC 7120 = FACHB-418]